MAVTAPRVTEPSRRLYARLARILAWLPSYRTAWLAAGPIAGLTLWGLVVPEAMADAGIAGLPRRPASTPCWLRSSCTRCSAPLDTWWSRSLRPLQP